MKNIEKFAKGEMSEDQERRYVESLYEKHYDQKLKSAYGEKLADKFNVQRSISDKKNTRTLIKRYIILGVSSIAALLVFIVYALPLIQKDNVNAQVYAQNLIVIDEIDVKRGEEQESQLKLDLIEAYNAGEYDAALSMFDQVIELTQEDMYYKGRLLLYQNKYPEAISTFLKINKPDGFKYAIELQYWLAVAYVSSGNNAAAKPLLAELKQSSWNTKEVNTLLSKLD